MTLVRHIPNTLTSLNLLCGCSGIMYAFTSRIDLAIYCIWVAMLFDFLDGFAARMLNVSSPIGKQLDSLADMVTFGVLPAIIMFQYYGMINQVWLKYTAFLIAIFSALRLAKFNIDDEQADEFIGVPTPANALFISGLYFLFDPFPVLQSQWILIGITLISSFWLVAPQKLLSLKFKSFDFGTNAWRYTLIIISIILILLLQLKSLSIVILSYIILSIIKNIVSK